MINPNSVAEVTLRVPPFFKDEPGTLSTAMSPFYLSHPHPPRYQRSEELLEWAEQVQRVVDVAAGEKLEQRGRDMATGKERREERREKATKREIDLLIATSSSHDHDASQHPPPPVPSPTIPPHPSIALTLSRFKVDSNPKVRLSPVSRGYLFAFEVG
jgi:hypothetical protein